MNNQSNNPNKTEAERLLAVAERLLRGQDFNGSRDFAVLAQENDPILDGSDQILAVADVLMASDKKLNNNHPDWYAILQVNRRSDDLELIKRQYRRLTLLLHPDKNRFPFADSAFRLVSDAWKLLSDPINKSIYDNEIAPVSVFTKVDLVPPVVVETCNYRDSLNKLPVRRGVDVKKKEKEEEKDTFWTVCPYCYNLYEYPKIYQNCCLKCQKCDMAFHGLLISPMPQLVPGEEAYYCSKAFFPINFPSADLNQEEEEEEEGINSEPPKKMAPAPAAAPTKKRGRSRKH